MKLNKAEIEQKKRAEEKVEEEYNDINSPHYRDNERYAWAIRTIKEAFEDPKDTIKN